MMSVTGSPGSEHVWPPLGIGASQDGKQPKISHECPAQGRMCRTRTKHPVMVHQLRTILTKQHRLRRNTRDLRFKRLVPCRSCHCPRRKPAPYVSRLNQVRHRMFLLDMIDTVLWSALPLGAPRHRALPQLGQVKVKAGYMLCHIMFYVRATIRATPSPCTTKVLFARVTQQLQFHLIPGHI